MEEISPTTNAHVSKLQPVPLLTQEGQAPQLDRETLAKQIGVSDNTIRNMEARGTHS